MQEKSLKEALETVQQVCEFFEHNPNHLPHILMQLQSEVGELATEVIIAREEKPGAEPGVDGVVGEAVDVIVTALDVIYAAAGTLDQSEISRIIISKALKWRMKYARLK